MNLELLMTLQNIKQPFITLNSKLKNMEVPAHTYTPRKKWTNHFMALIFFFFANNCILNAQNTFPILTPDSAYKIINNPKSSATDIFYGYRSLNRYYQGAGLFDSSGFAIKKMMDIAAKLNHDTLYIDAWSALGNQYAFRSDYNAGLTNYLKVLEYKPSGQRLARTLNLIAYLYSLTGNNELALRYLRKSDSAGSFRNTDFQRDIFFSAVFNNVGKWDSSFLYIQRAELKKPANPEPALYSVLLRQVARAYELQKDFHKADSSYQATISFCKREKQFAGLARLTVNYADFLLNRDSIAQAKRVMVENYLLAKQRGFTEAVSLSAEILKKIYSRQKNNDSAFYYSEIQIAYNDSMNNQKKVSEFQNLVFTQQLREIEESANEERIRERRRQNIQYSLIALSLAVFIFLVLLLIRSVVIHKRAITSLGIIILLIFFEFLNLLLHPFLERITHHSPVVMLVALVCIAALLIPVHHRLEKWATQRLVEKNNQIRERKRKMAGRINEKNL